jgi:hypothetical protein
MCTRAGGVAQWWSACLACMSPWVPSTALEKKKCAKKLKPLGFNSLTCYFLSLS